jgi:hypothetical protein
MRDGRSAEVSPYLRRMERRTDTASELSTPAHRQKMEPSATTRAGDVGGLVAEDSGSAIDRIRYVRDNHAGVGLTIEVGSFGLRRCGVSQVSGGRDDNR